MHEDEGAIAPNTTKIFVDNDPLKADSFSIKKWKEDKEDCGFSTQNNSNNSPGTRLPAALPTMDYRKKFQKAEHSLSTFSREQSEEEFQIVSFESLNKKTFPGDILDQKTHLTE